VARTAATVTGRLPVQVRFECGLTGEEYVTQQAWRQASLTRCPLHPGGGCGLTRHGTYERLSPPGARIARWYCRQGHCTISLLPDCLSSQLSGTLAELEAVVLQVEQGCSLEAACSQLRLDIELPGALRWVRRRVRAVQTILLILRGLLPMCFPACEPTLQSFARHLGTQPVLPLLRAIAASWLPSLPPPLGFRPRPRCGGGPMKDHQQSMGPDPPLSLP
jgi:hypothetical protein